MKKIIILVLVLSSVCFGFLPRGNVDSYAKSNVIVANPTDSLNSIYTQLKSSDRNDVMGTLSATNRRVILLTPGTYTQTSTLVLDTDYVDIASVSGSPRDTIVTRSTSITVKQTANDVCLTGFTIRSTSTTNSRNHIGFDIDITSGDNTDSYYSNMDFRSTTPAYVYCVFGRSNLDGTWEHCNADDYAWRIDNNKVLSATMRDCSAGIMSYAGDATGGSISGKFYRCVGGDYSFGACIGFGMPITKDAYFEDCISGERSFALGKEFAGTAIRCTAGPGSFGGWNFSQQGYGGTFSGVAEYCVITGASLNGNFGMGASNCIFSGQAINCRTNSVAELASGVISNRTGQIVDNSTSALYTTSFATGTNNNLVFTAVKKGKAGEGISIELYADSSTYVWVAGFAVGCGVIVGTTTATDVKNLLEADVDATALITVAYKGAENGSGLVEAMTPTHLVGGISRPLALNNHAYIPQNCVADASVAFFDNGQTYTNVGANGAITFTLPKAVAGLEYTFIDASATATADVTIIADGAETIGSLGTSAVGNTDDTYGIIHIKCVADGTWVIIDSTGTWN